VTAGAHEVVVTFIERSRVATDDLIAGGTQYDGFAFKGYLRLPRLVGAIQVVGPYAATGPTRTPSREKYSSASPKSPRKSAPAPSASLKISPGVPSAGYHQEDTDGLMAFYDAGHEGSGGFNAGIEQMVTAVLASPDFLYRGIAQPQDRKNAKFYALSDLERPRVCLSSCGSGPPTMSCSSLRKRANCGVPAY